MIGRSVIRFVAVFSLSLLAVVIAMSVRTVAEDAVTDKVDFVRDIQPLLNSKCIACHGQATAKSGLRLDVKSAAFAGGDSGAAIIPKDSGKSALVQRISSRDDDKMPPEGQPLSDEQVALIVRWVNQGAVWPDGVDKVALADRFDWWSLQPLARPQIPQFTTSGFDASLSISPIDAFVQAKLIDKGLTPSPLADRRTLARRLYFDLIGLPPTPEDVDSFASDPDPNAYERLVDRLLDSPEHGERWARHWLDVVHYGDTHGYDKDKPRPNAWPYRDYVIRAMNADKPYSQFVEEQIAGDILAGGTEDGLTATGFIAAGPWDFIGHAEVPESKTDGMIARNLDRDDMVTNTFNTFVSLTVQCARCHNHKFDPVAQEDYYRLQADFAALDRADRSYDIDPGVGELRVALSGRQKVLQEKQRVLDSKVAELGGEALKQLDIKIAASNKRDGHPLAAQFGYHSQIEPTSDHLKWVQVDLGQTVAVGSVELVGCHDDFNGIGAGFGFPVRFKIEMSDDENFQGQVTLVANMTDADFPNPGVKPLRFAVSGKSGRYIRVTATKLAPRMNDFIFALAELSVFDDSTKNLALGRPVQSLDSIEAAPRWRKSNLVDDYYQGVSQRMETPVAELKRQRDELLANRLDQATRDEIAENARAMTEVSSSLAKLPPPKKVYAGMIHTGSGTFSGTGGNGGKPREIRILSRGDVIQPGKIVGPGTVRLSSGDSGEFLLSPDHAEGQRRVALAKWITSKQNPLTWRSIVNRVWAYHFGRGIVESPNDFGRMGQRPSHPELLDWLAIEFRDSGQSLKHLHRMIVTSATYRQSSLGHDDVASLASERNKKSDSSKSPNRLTGASQSIDSGNVYLWRMNRRKLEAEGVRDAALAVAGKLNRQLGGPAFQDFVVEKPEHSPHYEYHLHDAEDERIHRRSVYRFLVRSQPQPFMTALDCADPSMSVDKRNETVTALQALALLNNRLMLTMAKYMALRVQAERTEIPQQVDLAFRLALSRSPTAEELTDLTNYAKAHGVVSVCRVLMNLNEFVFVD